MEIYIKPKRKTDLFNRKDILVSDVAEVVVAGDRVADCSTVGDSEKIEAIVMKNLDASQVGKTGHTSKTWKKTFTENHLISVMDIIKKIQAEYPQAIIYNVGESDTWVHAVTRKSAKSKFLWLKVAFVSFVLMAGAATAIMSFHTDGQIPKIFERYHDIIYGSPRKNPPVIVIPYAIGLAAGIIVFYNHVLGKKITDDPTPIEVEIETYEKEVTEAMVEFMEKKNEK